MELESVSFAHTPVVTLLSPFLNYSSSSTIARLRRRCFVPCCSLILTRLWTVMAQQVSESLSSVVLERSQVSTPFLNFDLHCFSSHLSLSGVGEP